jgi:diazepam-binding inhibitor (GABA receptor modulating acyl-CoA-binding protein)
MTILKRKFDDIVVLVKESDADSNPSNELKLEMYALSKQVTVGDVQGKKTSNDGPYWQGEIQWLGQT